MTPSASRTAEIRALAGTDQASAERILVQLFLDLFEMSVTDLRINYDQYSLNSLNGFFEADGSSFFFKFHQEDGEEGMSGEYYRAEILSDAGLPVDRPVHMSTLPGEQVLVYRRRSDPRFSDVLRELDLADDPTRRRIAVEAEGRLSDELLAVYLRTLAPATPRQVSAEPINRLFYDRMVDTQTGRYPGGRLEHFYVGKEFEFPGLRLTWEEFSRLRFDVNGLGYRHTVGELFDAAARRLRPDCLADAGGVVAHGDAHNANVWFTREGDGAKLSFFDPAFAGSHVPTLMAEVKATFHNVFAHPLWLYDPDDAANTFEASATLDGEILRVRTDWELTPVRRDLLDVKAARLWKPLLTELEGRGMLPPDWRDVLRSGLFLSPTLVMNLRSGARTHNPVSSLIAFSVAVMVGSPPIQGADMVTRFLASIAPTA